MTTAQVHALVLAILVAGTNDKTLTAHLQERADQIMFLSHRPPTGG